MTAYEWMMWVVVPFGLFGLFVVSLVKHEERLQDMQQQINNVQDKYINPDK